MRKSIRYKLFGVFLLLLSLFLLIFLLSSYFLEDIFILGNRKIMERTYNSLNETIEEGKGIKQEELIHMVDELGGNITLLTPNLNLRVTTSTFNEDSTFNGKVMEEIRLLSESGVKSSSFIVSSKDDDGRRGMFFIGKLNTGGFFIGEKSLKEIESSSDIARFFIIIAGLGTLIVGSILVFFLSTKITKPIVEINRVANEISSLNFDEKVNIDTDDELGRLGRSINSISNKLNKVLTRLKNANSKLKRDIEREKELEKVRRKFISNVSHELKTPISMIQGYTEGLKYNIAKTPEDREYYHNVIIDETEKMNNLINDLLKLSSYESGSFSISKEYFNIVDLLKEILEKHKINIEEKDMKLNLNIPDKLVINGDPMRIEQVITNFITNILRYGEKKGDIKISLEELKDEIKLFFYNSGDNIEEDELENIWLSFYKVEKSEKSKQKGTGLGLAIIKAIVESHGGRYGVINRSNGVEFWITLPKD